MDDLQEKLEEIERANRVLIHDALRRYTEVSTLKTGVATLQKVIDDIIKAVPPSDVHAATLSTDALVTYVGDTFLREQHLLGELADKKEQIAKLTMERTFRGP